MDGASPALRRSGLRAVWGVGILLLAGMAGAARGRGLHATPVDVPDAYFDARLAELGPLLRPEEAAAFDRLEGQRERLAFFEAFWRARDPTPDTLRNEARALFESRLRQALARLGGVAALDPEDARLRLISMLGEPDELLTPLGGAVGLGTAALSGLAPGDPAAATVPTDCPVPELELFVYHPRRGRQGLTLVVERTERGWRLDDGGQWLPGIANGLVLAELDRRRCREAMGDFAAALGAAKREASGWPDVLVAVDVPEPDPTWLEAVAAGGLELVLDDVLEKPVSDRVPDRVPELLGAFTSRRLEGTPDPRRPGRLHRESVVDVEALLHLVLSRGAAEPPSSGAEWLAVRIRGEVFEPAGRRGGMVRRRFQRERIVEPGSSGEVTLPLSFSAPSGSHLLVLQLSDASGRLQRALAFELDVPLVPDVEDRELGAEAPSLLERLDRLPSLRLRVPDAVLVGERPVQAITRGEIARVEYLLDGEVAGASGVPPFEASLDFGRLPLERGLEAVGFDAGGRRVASDRLVANPGSQRFRLDLVELDQLPGAVRARARLVLPVEARLERIEWFVDGRRLAVSSSEPLVEILPLDAGAERPPRYVRAVASLEDGRTVEDTRFLASDAVVERVEVDLVQLFVRVTDRRGRQIADLEPPELIVQERGEVQSLRTFERATELPLQLALLVDVSGTMKNHLELVRAAATSFLERLLRDRDQGAILAFRSAPEVIAPFGPAPEWMSGALTRFQAWGGTALWDSLALTAYYAQGLPGKKAVVVVTDGDDRHSALTSTDVEELAQRLGVAVYAIGVGMRPAAQVNLGAATVDHRRPLLTRLCRGTGGEFFPAVGAEGLERALATIEEDLRSQYVVTFQSSAEGDEFRRVRVEVTRPGARASTMAGYYP